MASGGKGGLTMKLGVQYQVRFPAYQQSDLIEVLFCILREAIRRQVFEYPKQNWQVPKGVDRWLQAKVGWQ